MTSVAGRVSLLKGASGNNQPDASSFHINNQMMETRVASVSSATRHWRMAGEKSNSNSVMTIRRAFG